jgi:hypothetical protein
MALVDIKGVALFALFALPACASTTPLPGATNSPGFGRVDSKGSTVREDLAAYHVATGSIVLKSSTEWFGLGLMNIARIKMSPAITHLTKG